jgi:glycosyltransferase-like protein
MSPPLRVAMLAHSTLPRGGVVHAMSLCEALTARGCEAVLHAPDASGAGFFRRAACATRAFPVAPAPPDTKAMVAERIADYVGWLRREANRGFDVYHAHDGISGAALARLKREGLIPSFVRTVHHLDAFADPRLNAWQDASIREADALLAVSQLWRRRLREDFGREATMSGNGVDLAKYSPARGSEDGLRAHLGLGDGPVYLAVGGVEARKNTRAMLHGFDAISREAPASRFVIAGGASLLDHSAYQAAFRADLQAMGERAAAVVLTGPVADADMPALYRLATALVFASINEGFGLCVLEAMACGTPVVVSRIAPFTEYLSQNDALFCDPHDPASIAAGMRAAMQPNEARRARGLAVAARRNWDAVAQCNLALYRRLRELAHA